MGEMTNACNIFIRRLKGRDRMGHLSVDERYISLGNIKMVLEDVGWKGVHWIHLTQDRDLWALVKTVMDLPVP
jgi:hypothetical protein